MLYVERSILHDLSLTVVLGNGKDGSRDWEAHRRMIVAALHLFAALLWMNDLTDSVTLHGKNYVLFPATHSWNEVNEICNTSGLNMLKIESDKEERILLSFIEDWEAENHVESDVWLGLHDSDPGASVKYEWHVDCSPIQASPPWANWEPNEQMTDFCIRMTSSGIYKTWNCKSPYHAICETSNEECWFHLQENRRLSSTQEQYTEDVAACMERCKTAEFSGGRECLALDYRESTGRCRIQTGVSLYTESNLPATGSSSNFDVYVKVCYRGDRKVLPTSLTTNNASIPDSKCSPTTTSSTTSTSHSTKPPTPTTLTTTTSISTSTSASTTTTTSATPSTTSTTTVTTKTSASTSSTTPLSTITSTSATTPAATPSTTTSTSTSKTTTASLSTTTTTTLSTTSTFLTTTTPSASTTTTTFITSTTTVPLYPTMSKQVTTTTTQTPGIISTAADLVSSCPSSGRRICKCGSSASEVIDTPVLQLALDKTSVSSYRRSKTSAPDTRASAISLGVCGVAVIALILGAVFLPDLGRLCLFLCQEGNRANDRHTLKQSMAF